MPLFRSYKLYSILKGIYLNKLGIYRKMDVNLQTSLKITWRFSWHPKLFSDKYKIFHHWSEDLYILLISITLSLYWSLCKIFIADDFIEAPPPDNVKRSLMNLKTYQVFNDKEELTPIGLHLASLPLDVMEGKSVIIVN